MHARCLRHGECDLAIAGGVNLMLAPEIMINICQAQMLSTDGRCHTFDQSANGYGRGEGAGIVLLQRLSDAIAARDTIEAVILASGTNQDGASSALSVPNGKAQQDLLAQVLRSSGLNAQDGDYIEAHGTGTALGDPVEMNAINQVYQSSHNTQKPLYVSTAKVNIGHLEAAAGVAGLIKVASCLKHKTIPPHIHLETLNKAIDLAPVPVEIPRELISLNPEKRSVAAISAFGFSGSNAHLILQEAPVFSITKGQKRDSYLIKLSAKTQAALPHLISTLLEWSKNHLEYALEDISYSLNIGRDDYEYRCVFEVKTLTELHETLKEAGDQEFIKNHQEIHWIIPETDADITFSIPRLKQEYEIAKQAGADDAFAWYYAVATYYLSLGLKPAKVMASARALLPLRVVARQLDLNEALGGKEEGIAGDFPVHLFLEYLQKALLLI